MPTSGDTSFPSRLTRVDELTRADHTFLGVDDECLFFGEYSARRGFAHSATNNLILNFKKPVRYRGTSAWQYKRSAINAAANAFSQNLATALDRLTLVPVPPSKLKNDPEYDDRIIQMLSAIRGPIGVRPDIRELVIQINSMPASHGSESRLPPSEWEKAYLINAQCAEPPPTWIGIIDDLVVTGCRFRAMSNVLKARFPSARITGLFIARRVPEATDLSDFDEDF